jgi:endothelin-converting enzyme/putative endopeptidase
MTRVLPRHPTRLAAFALTLALAGCSGGGDGAEIVAGIDPASMDRTADPCTDFFRYACGGFVDANPIGPDGAVVSRRAIAFFATERVESDIITDSSALADPDAALLGSYYAACNGAASGAQLHKDLDDLFAQIDAVTDADGLAKAVAAVHAVGGDALFSFYATGNLASPGTRMAAVDQGGIGMPDRSYYIDTSMPWVSEYKNHIGKLSALAGVNDAALPSAVVTIETQLAMAMLPPEEQRDPHNVFHAQDLASFTKGVPHFSWSAYFAATGAPSFTTVDVTVPGFFTGLESALASASLDDVKRYLKWRVIEAFAGALGDGVVAEEYAFHEGVFYGFSTPLPRDEYCLRLTASMLPWPLSRLYVARSFPDDAASRAATMMDDVRGALHDDLAATDWLDAPTRAAALKKLDAVRVAVGAPGQWPSMAGLTVDPLSFSASQAAAMRFFVARNLAKIGGADDDPWFMPPNTVNAAYSPVRNAIDFPAAILQAPLFDGGYAPAVNYGAMGAIMGHELTHGFDDEGRQFDPSGKLADWWSASTSQAFADRAACLVDQYDAIEAAPGVNVDGKLTLGENIADLGGVKLAYAALAPEGDDARAFFLAYAQGWCENVRPDFLATLARTDPHSPASARVNAVLANVPAFADAYGCAQGTPMAPPKRCAVW